MNAAQRWILACAVGCFAAGMATGIAASRIWPGCCGAEADDEADEQYARQLAADYGLSTAQLRTLRLVLRARHDEELAVFRRADFAQLPPRLQAELSQARRQERLRIRQLLDEDQRGRFDRQCGKDDQRGTESPAERKDEVKNG